MIKYGDKVKVLSGFFEDDDGFASFKYGSA